MNRLPLWGLLLCACAAPTHSSVGTNAQALGEPNGDYPNYDERVVLYATNRARTDPTAAGWASFPAQPPLQWSYDLNRSSRAHSLDMRDTPCFQHNSCDGTDIFQRILSYYTTGYQSIGENISAGVPDGVTAVYNWIYEIGAAPGTTGHRENIFSRDFTLLGSGYAPGGTQYSGYWTQDFIGTPVTRPHLTDGIHFPQSGPSGGQVTFGATYYDAGGVAASDVQVIIDGACHSLAKTRGTPDNATYEADIGLADGCHSYYFRSRTAGSEATYPDTGSLALGFGGASCPLFSTGHAQPICDGGGTGTDAGGGGGGDGGGRADSGGTGPGVDGGGSNPGGDPGSTRGGCSLSGAGAPLYCWLYPLGLLVLVRVFRRRRARVSRRAV